MITLQECPTCTHNYRILQTVGVFPKKEVLWCNMPEEWLWPCLAQKKHEITDIWVLILTHSGFQVLCLPSAEKQQQTFILGIWEVQREVTQDGYLSLASIVVPAAHLVLEKNLGWAQVSGKSLRRRTRALSLKIRCVECCTTWLFNGKDWRRQHSWKCCPSWGRNKVL